MISRFLTSLTEASMGCLMANLPMPDGLKVCDWAREHISPESLAESGYESCPHVTILYGFLPGVCVSDVESIARRWSCLDIRLGSVSRFENEANDVLKIDVESVDLSKLHYAFREEMEDSVEVSFPDYHAHVTLAYVKKGAHPELDEHAQFVGDIYRLRELVYSLPDSERKMTIKLGEESFTESLLG